MTLISCLELFSIYCHTKSFGYNDILNNDTLQITTRKSRPKALNYCEYNEKHSSLTVLASASKKIARHISRLVPRRHVTKHCPVKNMPAECASIQYSHMCGALAVDIVHVREGMVRHVTHNIHKILHPCIHVYIMP